MINDSVAIGEQAMKIAIDHFYGSATATTTFLCMRLITVSVAINVDMPTVAELRTLHWGIFGVLKIYSLI